MRPVTFLSLLAVIMLVFASCKKNIKEENSITTEAGSESLLSAEEINSAIENEIGQKGSFEWKNASLRMIWSTLQLSDHMMCIGYKPAMESDIDSRLSSININSAEWKEARQQVLQIILKGEQQLKSSLKIEDLEVWKESKLPVIDVEIKNIETIKWLRQSNLVRYAEPMGYDPIAYEDEMAAKTEPVGFSGSGCGGFDGNPDLKAGTDYTIISPNTKMSWNYQYHTISNAWTKSTGAGVKVMVIDTGISPDQDNFGSNFNQGQSSGRTIQKIVTIPQQNSTDDGCGHGTAMSGAIAAPRGTDGNSCGVAYNCNYVICRAANDVYIDGSNEVKGVSDAYTRAADDSSIKIISMSLGRVTGNGQIKDAILYAYGKNKLMFCAGGTSFGWSAGFAGVIFPASLEQVQAITGVQNKTTLSACEDCHKGKQIDFVIVMEQSNTKVHQITTAISGDVPTTVGGSSVSTATAAGIAALVWSRFPNYTREEVVNKLAVTASLYPNKSKNFGWGKLNAEAATN